MISIVNTTSQQRIGYEWNGIWTLILLNGLIEGVVLVYVQQFLLSASKMGNVLDAKTLIACRIVHIGTLIYASVIYHRHRHNRARELQEHLEQHGYDRFHNGPYGEDRIGTTDNQGLDSPSEQHNRDSPTVDGGQTLWNLVESDGAEVGHVQMPSSNRRHELVGEGEVHELATASSVRSLKQGGDSVDALSPSK